MAPLPVASPPAHDLPRRLGPLITDSSLPSTQTTPTPNGEGGHDYGSEVMSYTLDDADNEDQDPDDELDDDQEEEEEEEQVDSDDEDVTFYQPEQSSLHESAYYQNLGAYLSDSLDMSDDAGAPLVDYVVTQLLADGADTDGSAGSDSDADLPWADDGGSDPESDIVPDSDAAAETQSAAIEAHAQAATFANTAPFPDFPWDPLSPGFAWATHPFSISNPNPTTIGSSNPGLVDFLHHWSRQSRILQGMARGRCPWPARVNKLQSSPDESIEYDDLEGDQCDVQGIDWEDIGVTRRDARERRLLTYNNYMNINGSDRWTPDLPDVALPRRDSFFRFRRMDIKRNIHLSHFQLRNVLASTSRSRVFYPAIGSIQQFNPMSGHGRAVMKLSDAPHSQISTLAAGHGVLVAGGFGGEYMLRHLDSGEPDGTACHEGVITSSVSGITNHVAISQARTSATPLAAFASNDNYFRVLDLAKESWLSEEVHEFAPNCAALSPDRRLRVMVGDSLDVFITAAESALPNGKPDILHRLSGHRDYGFACDWADDGWTIATAFQDKTVKIWDARRFTDSAGNATSVCTIRSEMAGVRSLRFSPIGSGKRVLVAAEEADFINIIDAQTFRSKQTVDVFGELGGVSFENGGQDLLVLCCDRARGGIIQLERCSPRDESVWNSDDEDNQDWPRSIFTEERRFSKSRYQRRGRAAAYVDLDPF
ncbi:WD40-repeat-containing domain protein [Corynascus similis CBS 632.67]